MLHPFSILDTQLLLTAGGWGRRNCSCRRTCTRPAFCLRCHRLRRAAYVGVPRAVVEQMMQQEAMRVRLHGQPAAEPPYADFFAWAGQQPAAARGGGGG